MNLGSLLLTYWWMAPALYPAFRPWRNQLRRRLLLLTVLLLALSNALALQGLTPVLVGVALRIGLHGAYIALLTLWLLQDDDHQPPRKRVRKRIEVKGPQLRARRILAQNPIPA
jgi:hypothetical protein